MDTIKRYQTIEQLTTKGLYLLDNIWLYGNDNKFNSVVSDLTDDIKSFPEFNDHYDKLLTYKTLFAIDIEKDRLNGVIAQMMHSHVTDSWRLILLKIKSDMLKLINEYLWNKRKSMGYYIQQLQATFAHKNRAISTQRAIIKMLGKLLKKETAKSKEVIESVEHGYEMIQPKTHSIFGYWFSSG